MGICESHPYVLPRVTLSNLNLTNDLNTEYRVIYRPDPMKVISTLDNEDRHTKYDINVPYNVTATNMTYLMKLVLLTKDNPNLIDTTMIEHIKENKNEIHKINSNGWTPLMLAICNVDSVSSVKTVKRLLEYGASPNSYSDKMISPLMIAAYIGNIEVVKMLCNHKDIILNQIYYNSCKSSGRVSSENALSYALYSSNNDIQLINYLVLQGVQVRYECQIPLLLVQNANMLKEIHKSIK